MNRCLKIFAALAVLAWAAAAGADVPGHISYQGMLMDGSIPYTGEANFKFALVDSLTGDYFWTNDGSQGPPSAAVRIPVQDGVFSVLLGAPPMAAIDPSVISSFRHNQALRIWVEIGSHGEVLLGNLPLSSVLFAHHAELARASAGDFAAAGEIWSQSGGFKFPDGTVQETAATSGGGGDCLWSTGAGGRIYYSDGNVGIGNTNPARHLQIGDTGDSVSYLRLASNSAFGFSGLEFWDGEGNFSGMLQYAHNDDYMRFYTRSAAGAQERMRITSAGDVGIGLTNPTARLHVNGTARMNGFQLGASATAGHVLTTDASGVGTWQPVPTGGGGDCFWSAGTSGRIFYNGGNIGIGTDQPSMPLSVHSSLTSNVNPMAIFQTTGTNSVASVRFQNADENHFNLGITGGSHLALGYNANIGLAGDVLRITPEGNVGLGRLSPAAKLDVNGSIRMTGLQLGTSATEGYVLTANANGVGTWQAPTGGGDESPWVQSGNNIYYSGGNVGIGVSNPQHILDVGNPATNGNYLRIGSTNIGGIIFRDPDHAICGTIYYDHGGDFMRFGTRSGSDSSERMRITSAGDVGIGTTSPAARLHVNGTTRTNAFQLGTTATAGYVLTADASGVGTWQAPTGGGDFSLPYQGTVSAAGSAFKVENTSSGGHGVHGVADGGSARGVYGQATSGGTGAYGFSASGDGVSGNSNTGIGVKARTFSGGTALDVQGNGTTTAHPAARIVNNNSSGIAIFSTSQSTDANTVIVNQGSGDLIRGWSGSSGGNLVFRVQNDGQTSVKVLHITGGSDLAEKMAVSTQAEPGMVVAIDPVNPGKLRIAEGAYNRRVAGVVSGANGVDTGMLLSSLPGETDTQPIALSGRVWVYCDASDKAIEPGDMLTTSSRPGHAMAVSDFSRAHGAVLGKAMTALAKGEKGMVLALVNLQ